MTTTDNRMPFEKPCKDCGDSLRRFRLTTDQNGPRLAWSVCHALYCRTCAEARLAPKALAYRQRQLDAIARSKTWDAFSPTRQS